MTDCHVDQRPTDGSNLCHGCLDELKSELRSVAWLVEQLGITLTRQARVGQRNGPRGAETPLPFHLRASVDLETLRDGLGMWARAVAESRGIPGVIECFDAEAVSLWLLRHSNDIAQHPDVAELHGDILAMTHAAQRTIDLPPQRHFVGPCDECGADLYCGPQARDVACATPECDAVYPVAERRIWLLEQAVDQLRTAAELSRELPWIGGVTISRKMINQWAVRGHVTKYLPHPRDPRGYPRFRVGEIIDRARRHAGELAEQVAS